MKRSLNLFVLFAVLTTSSFAQTAIQDAPVQVPAEAVKISEELVAAADTKEEEGPSCIKSGVAYSPVMNGAQRKELFVTGQITDCEGNIWDIKIIPGTDTSKHMTIRSWRFAGNRTKELFQIDTYATAARHGGTAARHSFDFTKNSSKLLKRGIWDYMIVDGIYDSLLLDTGRVWYNAGSDVMNLRGSFGWIFGSVYAGLLKPVTLTAVNVVKAAYHVTKGTIVLVGGIAGTAGGIVATISTPVIVPAVEVMARPLLAVGSIMTTGSIIPGVIYVWNGAAWVTSQINHIPDEEVYIGGIRFVGLTNRKQPERAKFEVTVAEFKTIVEASVRQSALVSNSDEVTKKQEELRAQIRELEKEVRSLDDKRYAARTAHESHPVMVALRKITDRSYSSDVTVNPEVTSLALDDQKLRALVIDYASEAGLNLSEKEINDSVKNIKQNMEITNKRA